MQAPSLGPWLFGARRDLVLFCAVPLAAVALGLAGRALGIAALPDGAWLALVLAVDVAHVHATWFRTYFDRAELARRPLRYIAVPLIAFVVGVLCYHAGALWFWRGLAYLAVFHFVRQQAGWMALYRAKGEARRGERIIDEAAIYAATLYPLWVWHAHVAEKDFSWFVAGDFVELPIANWIPVARAVWLLALAMFALREAARWFRERRVELGKSLLLAGTALSWHVGIVENASDFVFTATNVIPHGVPYAYLLFVYTRARSRETPAWTAGQLVQAGFVAFIAVLVGLAFCEQFAWDRLVEHERPWLFGVQAALPPALLNWLVPLLALPQASHYLLDALLWRRSEASELPALRAVLGRSAEAAPAAAPAFSSLKETAHGR